MDGRYHPCPECPKGFTLKHQLSKHLQMEHASSEAARRLNSKRGPDVAAGKHNCYLNDCEAFFETADELNAHLTTLHGISLNKTSSGKRVKTEPQPFNENNIKKEEQIPLSISLGLPLPLPPFNPLNGHGSIHVQHPQMSGPLAPDAHQHLSQHNQHHQLQQQAAAHAMNNLAKHNEFDIKDFKNKCHECNIVFPNETDFKVHMYYKHQTALLARHNLPH